MDLYNLPSNPPAGRAGNKKDTRKELIVFVVLTSFIFGTLGGIFGVFFYSQFQEEKVKIEETGEEAYIVQSTEEEVIIKIVEDVSPAVVSIVISKDVPIFEQYFYNPFEEFNDFFGPSPFEYRIPQYRQKGTEKQEIGGGTGVIVSQDGIILTNKHVVLEEDAEYTVFTNDGKKFPARVLARDPVKDLAIIKIETENGQSFLTAKLGTSEGLKMGQTVIAIGNALGEFKNTVSVGVISGLGRTITASGEGFSELLENVIQTDAAINRGNSGGPLLNLKGEVVGINTAMVIDAQSIGFAIPIDRAKKDIEQVKTLGRIVYPFLGVTYILVNDKIKEEKGLSVDYGALIVRGDDGSSAIWLGSAAEKAGLKQGDIILELGQERITSGNSLAKVIEKYNPGDRVKIKYLRDREEKTIEVELGERSE